MSVFFIVIIVLINVLMFLVFLSVDVEKGSWLGTTVVIVMVNNVYIMFIYLKIDKEGSIGKCKVKLFAYNLFVIM